MSKYLPVPLRSEQPVKPSVVVVNGRPATRSVPPVENPLTRFILSVTPELLRAVERTASSRRASRAVSPVAGPQDRRIFTSGMNLTEYDVDIRFPFVRRVTVRRASAWASDIPLLEPEPRRSGRMRRAGFLGLGGAFAIAALGLLANRATSIPGAGSRRG